MTTPQRAESILALIDPTCTEFEDRLLAGESPSIDDFLDDFLKENAGEGRQVLLRELIALEIHYARERGAVPTVEEYLQRFPNDTSAVHEAFREDTGTAQDATLAPGSSLGPYRIVREIGRGGMGVVYEARHDQLDRAVALKLLLHQALLHPQAEERFQREARAIAKLHHSSIVPVFDYGKLEGMHYFAMQLIDGESLSNSVRRRGESVEAPLDEAALRQLLKQTVQIARALQFAHDRGVVHRDVKPSNILIDQDQAAWLVDFGVAQTEESDLTTADDLLGTVRYMPPERFGGTTSQEGDVYSLGVTLFEAMTQQVAYAETDPIRLMRAIVDRGTPRLRAVDSTAPRDLDTVLATAMAREPSRRYQEPGAFADDLERYLNDLPIHARRTGRVERAWRWARRNRAASALIAALAALAIVGTSLSILLDHRKREVEDLSTHVGSLLTESEKARDELREEVYRSDMQLGAQAVFRNRSAAIGEMLTRWVPAAGQRDLRGWEWHLLRSSVGRKSDRQHFDFGAGSVVGSAPGMVAVGGQQTVRVLAEEEWTPMVTLSGLNHPNGLQIDAKGEHALVSAARQVHVYSLRSGESLRSRAGNSDAESKWIAGTDLAVIMDPDPKVWNYQEDSLTPIAALAGFDLSMDVSEDGRFVTATSGAFIVRRVELSTGRVISEASLEGLGPMDALLRTALSPDGLRVAGAAYNGAIHVWEVATGARLARFAEAHHAYINSVRWSEDGTRLVSTSRDATAKIWRVDGRFCERVLRGPVGYPLDATFTSTDSEVISTGCGNYLTRWDMTAPPGHIYIPGRLDVENPGYRGIVWAKNGRSVHVVDRERTDTWDISGPTPVLVESTGYLFPMTSPDGTLELRAAPQSLSLIELATGRDLLLGNDEWSMPPPDHGYYASTVAWSTDSLSIYASDGRNGWRLTDLRGEISFTPLTDVGRMHFLSMSPRGRYAVLSVGPSYRVLELSTGRFVATIDPAPLGASLFNDPAIAFTAAGDLLALAAGPEIYFVNTETWQREGVAATLSGNVLDMEWSPDGQRLATSVDDGTVRLLDTSANSVIGFPTPFPVFNLSWDPEGKRLAAIDETGGWHLWNASASLGSATR